MATAQASFDSGSFLLRIQDLLRRKPNLYDVVFCVGPAQKKVKGVRILLEAASSALEKKFDFWDSANVPQGQGKGIPIPDFEPDAFEIFVKLTMFDDWTAHSLENLKLQPGQILNLISICRAYEIKVALNHLEDLMKSFYSNFASFMKTPNFLRLSYAHLESILASDNLPLKELDVFNCACRWGKGECERRGIEGTSENIQLVLGDAIYKIRFTLMTPLEFNQCIDAHNILTEGEGFRVYRYLVSNEAQRAQLDSAGFPFKTKPRSGSVQSTMEKEGKANLQTKVMKETTPQFCTLDLTMGSKIVDNPAFVCDGTGKEFGFTPKRAIRLLGLGFLGPIDGDALYEVKITIKKFETSVVDFIFWPKVFETKINAQKGNVFRIMFQPITLKERSLKLLHGEMYYISYSLKGPSTKSFQKTLCEEVTAGNSGNEFSLQWNSDQLAEILYTNV